MNINFINSNYDKTIVFIHGNSSSSRIFDYFINSKKIKANLLSYDLYGHGTNNKSELINYSLESLIEQLKQLILPIKSKIILIGHSLGGHIAIEALPQIDNVESIVLIGTPPLIIPLNFNEAFHQTSAIIPLFSDIVDEKTLEIMINEVMKNKENKSILVEDYYNTDTLFRTNLAKQIQNNELIHNEVEILNNTNSNVYLIHCEFERFVNLEYLKSLKNIKNNLFIAPESGHYLPLENPKWLEDFIIEKLL